MIITNNSIKLVIQHNYNNELFFYINIYINLNRDTFNMPIELDDTTINIIDGADTYQLDFVKSKGSYNEILTNSKIYSCGYGSSGKLGHGNTSSLTTPTLIQYFINNKITISQIYSNSNSSIFLTTDGNVYTCGSNGNGQLGHGDTASYYTPTLIETYIDSNGNNINYTNITISQVSANIQHTIFLDTNGYVYSCGYGFYYQLGHDDNSDKYRPTLIQYFSTNNITISQVSAGESHSLFLDSNGRVYTCGYNNNGQLGHGDATSKNTPTLIETYIDSNGNNINYTNITISRTYSNSYYSIFLDTNGYVYSCGSSYYGQLGHGDTSDKYTPTIIQYFVTNNISISHISVSPYHSIFLATNGNVYSCGYGYYGQLGHGDTSDKYTPTLIQYFVTNGIFILQVSCCGYFSIFLATNGNVYSCGYGYYGQLGHGDTSDKYTPTLIQYFNTNSISISQVSCGSIHSIFLSNDPYYQAIEYDAQWTYSSTDASVYHLGNVGIGTYPSNTKILNVENGINFTGDLYINNNIIDTPKYKHYAISHSNRYLPEVAPEIAPYSLPNNNEYQIFTFVYDSSNNNGSGQTEYTINFNEETECDILVVAGGGGGGAFGGGGGGGGLLFSSAVKMNGEYKIKVGKGGVGYGTFAGTENGENGYNSSITINNIDVIAFGGGGGGTRQASGDSYRGRVGNEGGSGGGGSHANTGTQMEGGVSIQLSYNVDNITFQHYGNIGGKGRNGNGGGAPDHASGGGGGAGFRGEDAVQNTQGERTWSTYGGGGDGGIGKDFSSYFGTSVGDNGWFAGGGGGNTYNSAGRIGWGSSFNGFSDNVRGYGGGGDGAYATGTGNSATDGMANTGGGGGGGNNTNDTSGDGGSGVVIIRCKISKADFNIPLVSEGVTNNFNKFEQTNTLTFSYDEKYLRYNYYPELTTFSDTANLIAWYKFDAVPTNGATLTNYGSGGTAYDATLNIASNGIERLPAENVGYKYYWKSDAVSGNYISVPPNILESLYANGHTICFWGKDASTSDNDYTVLARPDGTIYPYIRIHTPWSNGIIYYDNGNGTVDYGRLNGASGIGANELVFWAFTRENISSTQMMLKIYKNGIMFLSGTYTRHDFTNVLSSSIFYIGYNTSGEFIFQNKSLEDFRIYDRALRHEEIEQLHLEFTNNKLHAHYKFNDSSNLGLDSTSNSYDATIYGTPEHISPDTISFNVGDGSQYLIFPVDVIKDSGTTREELSFSIWVNKQESYTGTANYFGIDNDTDTNLSKTIFFGQSNSGSTYTHIRYGSNYVNINTAYDNRINDIWNHYALVLRKDGSNANIKFYVNGIEYTAYNSNVAWIELDDNLKINRWQLGEYHQTSKHIRDFRVYNTALSASQIRYIYKSSSSVYNQSKYTLQFDRDTECDILVVAGGGGGCGNNSYRAGGGGGAGELLEKYNLTFTADTLYTIVVGNGGNGQLNRFGPAIEGFDSGIYTGANGDTPFYHSRGGGRGGGGYNSGDLIFSATSGGSGGGASMDYDGSKYINYSYGLSIKYNTDGHGHDGKMSVGLDAGSGGGAGSIGEYSSSSLGQAQSLPGKGYTSYITGVPVTYASGGYGGWQYSRNTANAGKGSGGWGYGGPQAQYSSGGDGIDGIVIIKYRYLTSTPVSNITYTMNSWTYTDDGNVYYMGNVGIGSSSPTERLDVGGSISATTKSFKIQHPLNNDFSLYHGNIECPRYDNIYRGRATIVGGTCIVDIDKECNDVGGLIEGTFEALNTDSQLYLQNNQTFDNVKGTIENGKIHIECENTEDEITINWIVIAERKDANLLKLNNTDTAGKLICEHFK